ncbi:Peroxisomal membrane protein 11-4 [Linum grandiflorum]
MRTLAVLANAGEMVYFFFDHFLWLARIGTLDARLARRMSFVSAFGESFGYVFFVVGDLVLIREGIRKERELVRVLKEGGKEDDETASSIAKIRGDRVMRLMGIAANLADLIIALADIEPNPFCNHTLTLGISGLVSAWAGWYRNWPG